MAARCFCYRLKHQHNLTRSDDDGPIPEREYEVPTSFGSSVHRARTTFFEGGRDIELILLEPMMSPESLAPQLFSRAWAVGLQTVREKAICSFEHMTVIPNLSLSFYEFSCPELRRDMEIILQIGLSRLLADGEVKTGPAGYSMASANCGLFPKVSVDGRQSAD